MIVYIASCNDKNHTFDSMVISKMKTIPGIVDSFQNYVKIRDGNSEHKFCIAAIAIGDDATVIAAKKIMDGMFPFLKEIRRLNESSSPG